MPRLDVKDGEALKSNKCICWEQLVFHVGVPSTKPFAQCRSLIKAAPTREAVTPKTKENKETRKQAKQAKQTNK
jgi:hypothetical protein